MTLSLKARRIWNIAIISVLCVALVCVSSVLVYKTVKYNDLMEQITANEKAISEKEAEINKLKEDHAAEKDSISSKLEEAENAKKRLEQENSTLKQQIANLKAQNGNKAPVVTIPTVPSNSNKVCYLTFDDGPRPEVTPWVLDLLDKYNAKATFFCIGKNVEMFPELFEEVKRRGHAVGNHSYSHVKGWGMKTGDYVRDIDIAGDMIKSNLFRPPYARIGPNQARVLNERYHHIMWNIISRDYNRNLSGDACARNVIPYLEPGAIIVFHDSIKCSRNLFEALPQVLEAIKEKGLICKRIEL